MAEPTHCLAEAAHPTEEELEEYLLDWLGLTHQAAVEAHLRICAGCRARSSRLAGFVDLVVEALCADEQYQGVSGAVQPANDR